MKESASVIFNSFQPHSRVPGSRNVREEFCQQNNIGNKMPQAVGNDLRSRRDGNSCGDLIR
jgi:hypothetical protein